MHVYVCVCVCVCVCICAYMYSVRHYMTVLAIQGYTGSSLVLNLSLVIEPGYEAKLVDKANTFYSIGLM